MRQVAQSIGELVDFEGFPPEGGPPIGEVKGTPATVASKRSQQVQRSEGGSGSAFCKPFKELPQLDDVMAKNVGVQNVGRGYCYPGAVVKRAEPAGH